MSAPGALQHRPTYAGPTANMRVDPAASPSGDAVESISAPCVDRVDLEWVPELEDDVVPAAQLALCLSCPLRADCLQLAVTTDAEGYWGGTTSADRRWLVAAGDVDLEAADRRRREVHAELKAAAAVNLREALHEPGRGSLTWYRRRGCRCSECRAANTANRARQRARRRMVDQTPGRRRQAA